MSTSDRHTASNSRASPSESQSGPEAAGSERDLSDGSLHYYSTDDEDQAAGNPYKLIPIRNAISGLQENEETVDIDSSSKIHPIFPSHLGGPDEIPTESVNACFPRSGPHIWLGRTDEESKHPLHGQVFSLYYGPSFRQPKAGWVGNERIDWLRYLWDWRPAKDHKNHTFETWIYTVHADELWKRRLRDKACEYYVEFGTVEGTVLEARGVESRGTIQGPYKEHEPDVYVLRSYLRRIELGQAVEGLDGLDRDSNDEEEGEEVGVGAGYARSDRSRESSEATSSVSSSVRAKMRARTKERQTKGIKAPPSSIREPTPEPSAKKEQSRSRLQFLKVALGNAWSKQTSSTSPTALKSPPSMGPSQSGPPAAGEFPASDAARRRRRQGTSMASNWPFQ